MDNGEYHLNWDGKLLLDEQGEPIPKSICICFAHEPNECVCGAWDDVEGWYDDENEEH